MMPSLALAVTCMIFALGLGLNSCRLLALWALGRRGVTIDDPFINASAAFLFFTFALVFAR